MNIRKLGPADDVSGAVLLPQRFFREEGFDTPDDAIAANARKMTGIEACGLFVAEDRDAAIGVATVSLEFGIEYGWLAEMGDLYVVPEWRGRGLSGAIIAEIEAFLKARSARGYQTAILSISRVLPSHAAARRRRCSVGVTGTARVWALRAVT